MDDFFSNNDYDYCIRGRNRIYDILIGSSTPTIGIDDVKGQLKIDYTDDDTYLPTLISACQAKLERYCGLSFAARSVTAFISNESGSIELPYGPFISLTSITDKDGNAITDYTLEGVQFQTLKLPTYDKITVTYQAGYTTIPDDLKMALILEVVYRYEHRGDEVDAPAISTAAQAFCNSYKRYS